MNEYKIKPIGFVINEFNEPAGHQEIKNTRSKIIVSEEYSEALLHIEESEYLDIVFYFHQSEELQLAGETSSGSNRGIFASRSPQRPNAIGVTSVKLLERNNNELIVEGLDAINQTPVIDIKCSDTSLFAAEAEGNPVHKAKLKSDPRIEIRNNIANNNTELLLIKAGQMHGHYCPGLAMGVMAATYAMNQLNIDSDGMEDLLAITETNNCFSDGVQLVTGCSFGNNSLIYKDVGKTAFTLTKRDGKGIRICSRHESRDVIQAAFPDFQALYTKVVKEQNHDPELVSGYRKVALERAFGTLLIPFDQLFSVQETNVEIPSYASIYESVVCAKCGENVMKPRTKEVAGRSYCYDCAGVSYPVLDGNGIHC